MGKVLSATLAAVIENQEEANRGIHPDWRAQDYNWSRALWMSCANLMDNLPWKWWESPPEEHRAKLRTALAGVFQAGLSLLMQHHPSVQVQLMLASTEVPASTDLSMPDLCDRIAASALAAGSFALYPFIAACRVSGISEAELYRECLSGPILGEFRRLQRNRKGSGQYLRYWTDGREDREHLLEIMERMEGSPDMRQQALQQMLDEYER